MPLGTCKLTGDVGPMVKAHILPAALTAPVPSGMPFAQAGRDTPPIKRWSSWYDPAIVTRTGEDILERYDTWAIAELRRNQLVWSGWSGSSKLTATDYVEIPGAGGYGYRQLAGIDGPTLRLFLISLLWRAAVSNMVEFAEIDLKPSDTRRIRRMIVDGDHLPLSRFPITLTQLCTKGDTHNLTPLAQNMSRDPTNPAKGTIPIFRFYFDGLIAHFHRRTSAEDVAAFGDRSVGSDKQLTVLTVPFESSWQRENMDELVREAEERWPDRLARIPGFRPTR